MATKEHSILTTLAAILAIESQGRALANVDVTAFAAAYLTVARLGY